MGAVILVLREVAVEQLIMKKIFDPCASPPLSPPPIPSYKSI